MTTEAQRKAAEAKAKKAEAEAQENGADDKEAKASEGAYIAFKGHNGVRIISAEDWEAIGVKDQEESRWDKSNAWRLPREEFGARALNYLLKVDGEFAAED